MASNAQHRTEPGGKELADAVLLAASSIRRKLIARLDARLVDGALLGSQGAADALLRAARGIHPDLEPLARHLGRVLALAPGSVPPGQLGRLAEAGFVQAAEYIGRAAAPRAATVAAKLRQHPLAVLLAAAAVGYVVGRSRD